MDTGVQRRIMNLAECRYDACVSCWHMAEEAEYERGDADDENTYAASNCAARSLCSSINQATQAEQYDQDTENKQDQIAPLLMFLNIVEDPGCVDKYVL